MKKITLVAIFFLTSMVGVGQNNSLQFDGSDDYVSLGNNFNFTSTDVFTAEAWVKATPSGNFQQIISKLDTDFRGWGLQISPSGFLSGYLFSDFQVNQRYVIGSAFITDDAWHHVAMTFDGVDTIVLYVDGVLDPIQLNDDEGATLASISNTADIHIGSFDADGAPGEFFAGGIDEVRIWDIVRTGTEISDNYQNELNGSESNLIGYYKFDIPNSSCDIQDCNANEVHGTRNGPGGANNLPQFSSDTPTLSDVPCGVSINCTLGVEDSMQITISLLPNPTRGILNVVGSVTTSDTFKVYNVHGAKVAEGTLEEGIIDITNVSNGLYFISLTSGSQSSTQRIIKE